MKLYALRMLPGQDIKAELIRFTQENNVKAGFVITAVGSVTKVRLRMADEAVVKDFNEKHEIVSMTGTLCQDDVHIHASFSDAEGKVIGGHMKEGCIVYVTVELVIGETDQFIFSRTHDPATGFPELVIKMK